MPRTALLVIDMQQGLFEGGDRPSDADALVARVAALAARARAAGALVVLVQHDEPQDAALVHGSPGWQLVAGLRTAPGDVRVRKSECDSFVGTPLQQVLQGAGVQNVVVCGVQSEFCVDHTARRAAALGYAVTLAGDAHGTGDKPHASGLQIRAHHNMVLSRNRSAGGTLAVADSAAIAFA